MMWDHGAWNTTKYSHHYWFQRLDFYEHQWWASQIETTQFSFEDQHGIHPLLLGVKSNVKQGPLTNHGNGLQVLEEEQIPQSQEIQSASLINFLSSKDQCFSWTLEFTTVPDTALSHKMTGDVQLWEGLISTWDRLISPFCWSGPGPAATPGMQKGYQARAAPELRVAAAPQRAVPRNVTKVPCLAASKGNPANC